LGHSGFFSKSFKSVRKRSSAGGVAASDERIAAAFVRQFRATRFAPEEIREVTIAPPAGREGRRDGTAPRHEAPFDPRPERGRDEFAGSVWFALSVGRAHGDEPRRLIPMLCKAGHITKRDIGAIKLQPTETLVEIHPSVAGGFVAALGPQMNIEGRLWVRQLGDAPDLTRPPRNRERLPERSRERLPERPRENLPERPREDKPERKKRDAKPAAAEGRPFKAKPYDKSRKPPRPKGR
jgi:ATP-dependent RNA helicase DeaD